MEIGRTNAASLPWLQLALGMAEYRSGHFAAAEQALLATKVDDGLIGGTAVFIRDQDAPPGNNGEFYDCPAVYFTIEHWRVIT